MRNSKSNPTGVGASIVILMLIAALNIMNHGQSAPRPTYGATPYETNPDLFNADKVIFGPSCGLNVDDILQMAKITDEFDQIAVRYPFEEFFNCDEGVVFVDIYRKTSDQYLQRTYILLYVGDEIFASYSVDQPLLLMQVLSRNGSEYVIGNELLAREVHIEVDFKNKSYVVTEATGNNGGSESDSQNK